MTIGRAPLRRSTGGPTRSVLLAAAVVLAALVAASARTEAAPADGRVEALLRGRDDSGAARAGDANGPGWRAPHLRRRPTPFYREIRR